MRDDESKRYFSSTLGLRQSGFLHFDADGFEAEGGGVEAKSSGSRLFNGIDPTRSLIPRLTRRFTRTLTRRLTRWLMR